MNPHFKQTSVSYTPRSCSEEHVAIDIRSATEDTVSQSSLCVFDLLEFCVALCCRGFV